MQIADHAGLGEVGLAEIAADLGTPATLAEVLRWGFSSRREVAEIVVQDEYTQDVVMPWRDELYLVFDTS